MYKKCWATKLILKVKGKYPFNSIKLAKVKKKKKRHQILLYTIDRSNIPFPESKWSKALNLYTTVGQGIILIEIYNDKIIMIIYKSLCTNRLNTLIFLRAKIGNNSYCQV